MSGARLCSVLGELGIGGHGSFEPDSFEWPFQYEEYEQLLNEGKLLEGEDLDSAYDSISAFSSRKDNQEALFRNEERLTEIREAKSAYKEDALEMQKQLQRQKSQFSLLAGQVSSLIQGKRARVAAVAAVNGQLAALDEKLAARNLEMDAVLGKIASTAQKLAHYHKGDENTVFLAYSDFHSYLIGDLACGKELNLWFSKQFDKGPFRLVAEEGKSNCSWVSLDVITTCLKRVYGSLTMRLESSPTIMIQRLIDRIQKSNWNEVFKAKADGSVKNLNSRI
ncbi:hypothetical protein M5K25_023609 [Dendrobium thyrsiflorum]|uniref:HAUS augmin-like complex subunit 3 N-terminal domain-containing protein n=1 Tax=Dendrobium thyrsiflorum TaxID=117978 RepID=A0ABD0U8L5_DENTH